MSDVLSLETLVQQVRRDILRMVHKVNSGHPGGSLGCAEFLVVLYNEVMDHNKNFNMNGEKEDVFFLSNGHISPVFYSVLARNGYFPIEELNTFRLINSRLQGHPTTHEGLPGIRIASGSLGQGLSVAIGTALSKKINKDPKTVFVLMGDGELQEGNPRQQGREEGLEEAGAPPRPEVLSPVPLCREQACDSAPPGQEPRQLLP